MSAVISPTEYVIRTKFEVTSNVPGLTNVKNLLGGVENQVGRISSLISGRMFAGIGALAGAFGFQRLTSSVIEFHTSVQNAEIGVAALLSSLGGMKINDAMRLARDQVRGLRDDAAKGAGELDDYVKGFQTILGPAGQAGASVPQIRELNKMAIAASSAMMRPLNEGARDIVQALNRGVEDKVTPIAIAAVRAIGMTEAEFKKLGRSDRLQALMKGFATFKDAAELASKSWEARIATLKDRLKEFARSATADLFNSWNDALGRTNDWLEKNRSVLNDIARQAGKVAFAAQGRAIDNAGNFATAGAVIGGGAIASRAGLAGASVLGIGGGAASMVGAALGIIIAGITGPLAIAAQKWPGYITMISESFGKLGAAFMNLFESVMGVFDNRFTQFIGGLGFNMLKTTLDILTDCINTVAYLADIFGKFLDYISNKAFSLIARAQGDDKAEMKFKTDSDIAWFQAQNLVKNWSQGYQYVPGTPQYESYFKSIAEGRNPPVTNFNQTFTGDMNITIKTDRLDDPDLVATAFEKFWDRFQKFPTTSYTPRMKPK